MSLDRIMITGGGIAGLSAALALAHAGQPVVIYEKSASLQEVGAGIQLGPNATRLLQQWGVLEALISFAFAPQFIHLKDGITGKKLTSLPIAHFAHNHWRAPYLSVHRADLQKALLSRVAGHPLVALHCAHEVCGISGNLARGFEAEISHQEQIMRQKARLFVACDGVWSRMRANKPLQEKAADSGFVAWRATLPYAQLPSNFLELEQCDNVHVFMGAQGHFIAYPIRGGSEFNFVAITRQVGRGERHPIGYFEGWTQPVRDVLTACQGWTYWPLFTMKIPRFMGPRGEIFLGDSAHATTPFAAQGAALAIEDGAALAQALSHDEMGVKESLAAFAQARCERVHAVNRRGNFNRFVYHAGWPLSFGRNIFMTRRDPAKFLHDLNWLYHEII